MWSVTSLTFLFYIIICYCRLNIFGLQNGWKCYMLAFYLLCKCPINVVGLCICFLSLCWLGYHLFLRCRGACQVVCIVWHLKSNTFLWVDFFETYAYCVVGNSRWKVTSLLMHVDCHNEPWGCHWCGQCTITKCILVHFGFH